MSAGGALLAVVAVPVCVACGYLAVLTAFSRRGSPPRATAPGLRFDVIVPAHDEEEGIAATVKSLLSLAYPRDLYRVVVVADNCSDATAARARDAGAQVLVRDDEERRGKGYALEHAFARSLEGKADAVVVIDADTVASDNLLSAFAARIANGAQAVQADYGVRNPQAGWRTRLMTLALAMFHVLRSLGRERLRLSCGLRGNGMCFTRALLGAVPHEAYSIVEDLEYGIRIGEAGYRVHYAEEAHVFGEMVSAERASRSQRKRWERGRLQLARRYGARLLAQAFARRDKVLLDLALDVLVPPLSYVASAAVVGLGASAALVARGAGTALLWPWGASVLALIAYVLRGWQLSGTGARGLLALLWAPAYVLWKATLLLRRDPAAKGEWIRTQRQS